MQFGTQESGHDLGLAARGKLAKSSESIVDLAVVIHRAYDLYYAPRAKRGRPKGISGTPKDAILREQEKQWKAFLAASGYDMSQHSKLLRNYWRVGKRAGVLRKYSENLPNSLDALAELCTEGIKEQEFLLVLAELNQQHTADDVRFLLKASQAVPLDEVDNFTDLMADYHQSEVKHRFKEAMEAQRQAANSVGLFSVPPIEVTRRNTSKVVVLAMVARHLGFMKLPESELAENFGEDFVQLHETLNASNVWRKSATHWLDYLVRNNGVELYLEKVMDAA
jgi:hypothetical protein